MKNKKIRIILICILIVLSAFVVKIKYDQSTVVFIPNSKIDLQKECREKNIKNLSKKESLEYMKNNGSNVIEFLRKKYILPKINVYNTGKYYRALTRALYVDQVLSEEYSDVRAFVEYFENIGHTQAELVK